MRDNQGERQERRTGGTVLLFTWGIFFYMSSIVMDQVKGEDAMEKMNNLPPLFLVCMLLWVRDQFRDNNIPPQNHDGVGFLSFVRRGESELDDLMNGVINREVREAVESAFRSM